jgi:hypothetical protein
MLLRSGATTKIPGKPTRGPGIHATKGRKERMARKRLLLALVLLGLPLGTASAQDAKAALQAAATAMGTANVKSVQYSGTGC